MFKKLLNKKLLKNQKGLTIVELLAVIVILAIIAAIAIPAIGNIIENSRYNAVKADAINVLNAAQLYYTDNPKGESTVSGTEKQVTVEQLEDANYLESAGKIPPEAYVSIDNPKKLNTSTITFSGSKSVSFKDATIKIINDDTQKGSKIDSTHTVKPGK